jgi:hypothetical protein
MSSYFQALIHKRYFAQNCIYAYELSACQASNAWVQWFIIYHHETEAKYRFHAAAMLLFYIQQKYKLHVFQRSVTIYHFRTLYY